MKKTPDKKPAARPRMMLEFFQNDYNRQWYWRLEAPNGRSVACGGEGYGRLYDCRKGAERALWLSVRRDMRVKVTPAARRF